MFAEIDKSRCQGHALCAMASEDYFELDDLGYIASDSSEVPSDLHGAAEHGAGACPEKVITLSV